jgi:hypothetical protein
LTNSQKSSGFAPSLVKKTNMVSQKQPESKHSKPGKAFEYKENKEESKNPQKQTFGGWDVPEDDFDASDNSDLHYNDNLKNANDGDWDYEPTNKPVPKTQVEASSPKLAKHKTSGIKYGYVEESDESESDKESEEDYDWGSLEQ